MAKVVLVTGAQQGIGAATAVAFAAVGYDVAVNWLDDEAAADAVAARVRDAGQRALTVRADVGDMEQIAGMVETAVSGLGGLDVLVNNAGVFPRVPFLEMTPAQWDFVHGINLKGTAFCAQAAARAMIAAGTRGSIVNLSSRALSGTPLGVHYSATKAGVVGLTRAMALALAPHGVRVNAIAPGLTDTAQPRYGNTDAELQEMAKAVPLGRMASPADIAGVAVFLASDAAAYMTGEVVHVNGGAYMG
ncbi:MAG: SDR family oxidoreductase [Rhodospirillales bacterium]|nr:SDR family oxidoreductase [Rhodospirillales bacterium]